MSRGCHEEIGRVGRGCYEDATRKLLPWNSSLGAEERGCGDVGVPLPTRRGPGTNFVLSHNFFSKWCVAVCSATMLYLLLNGLIF